MTFLRRVVNNVEFEAIKLKLIKDNILLQPMNFILSPLDIPMLNQQLTQLIK